MKSISDSVLETIENHRPHLKYVIDNLKAANTANMAKILEKRLADAYLIGETRLSAQDTYALSSCCACNKFGA